MKWTLIRSKRPSAIAAAVPTVIAFVAVMTVLVTVGVILTGAGYILAAMRQKSRRKKALSDGYMLPEGYVDFRSGQHIQYDHQSFRRKLRFEWMAATRKRKSPETQIAIESGQLRSCRDMRCPLKI